MKRRLTSGLVLLAALAVLLPLAISAAEATVVLRSPFFSSSSQIQWRNPGVSVPGTMTASGSSETITRLAITRRNVSLQGPTLSSMLLTGGTVSIEHGSTTITMSMADYDDDTPDYVWDFARASDTTASNAATTLLSNYSSSTNTTVRFNDGVGLPPSISRVTTVPSHNSVEATVTLDRFPSDGGPVSVYHQFRGGPQRDWSDFSTHRAGTAVSSFTVAGLAAETAYELRVYLDALSPGSGTQVSFRTTMQPPDPIDPPSPPEPQSVTLGEVQFTVGCSGDSCGFASGYGTLSSGDFPGELFGDGSVRTVAAIREDADGDWYLVYSGGTAQDWGDDDTLTAIVVEARYADGKDTRRFAVGGFIDERAASNVLKLDPPIPSRDWQSRAGESVVLEFRRHSAQTRRAISAAIAEPTAEPGTIWRFLADTTPGGPVVAQNLIVILVYGMWAVRKNHSTSSLLWGGVILVLTPWVPVIFQFGTPMAAVINMVNLGLGAYVYKYFFEGREQYS